MKSKISIGMKRILKSLPYIAIALLVGVVSVYAAPGSKLTPPGVISNTMYSLTDIYNLASGTTATEGVGDIEVTPALGETGVTLTQVYNAVADALQNAGGIDLSGMYNGSCGNGANACSSNSYPGGSQALGGVDDANYDLNWVPQTPPSDRYETEWTECTVGNNYCGTNDAGANMKDEATGLVWSYPLKNTEGVNAFDTTAPDLTGCDTGNCAYWNTDTNYSWDNSNTNNDGQTAQALCQNQGEGWYLPHQKQLMQAYIDGSYGNLEPIGVDRVYWSATTSSNNEAVAWDVYLSVGDTNYNNKYNSDLVRCVQE